MIKKIVLRYAKVIKDNDNMRIMFKCIKSIFDNYDIEITPSIFEDIICMLMNVKNIYDHTGYELPINNNNFKNISEHVFNESKEYVEKRENMYNARNIFSIFLDNLIFKDLISSRQLTKNDMKNITIKESIEAYKQIKNKLLDKIFK